MKLTTHLTFDGNCEEAFRFYAQCLGGRIDTLMTWEQCPATDELPKHWLGKVMHTSLTVGDFALIGNDTLPPHFQAPQGFAVALTVDSAGEAERVFAALAEGGMVQMPLEQTFFAARFGMLRDRFGIPWMVVTAEGP